MLLWMMLTALAASDAELVETESLIEAEVLPACALLEVADGADAWLEAWATNETLNGRYELNATLILSGGEADISQEGFIESTDEALGEIFIQAGAGYGAVLRLYDVEGVLVCEELRSA